MRLRNRRSAGPAVVLSVILVTGSVGWLAASPAAAVVPPTTKTVSMDATFSTSGQSLWGPGASAPPATQNIPLFDESWNESATGGAIESVDLKWSYEAPCFPDFWNLCDYTTDFGNLGDFGATGTVSSSGRIGMSVALEGVNGGTIGVNYPVKVDFTLPADETFGAGDTIEIGTSVAARPGGRIDAVQPSLTGEAINGTFGFHAGLDVRACIFECFTVNQALIDVNETTGNILHVTNAEIDNQLGADPDDTYCFALPENLLFGLTAYHLPTRCPGNSGYLARPTVDVTTTTNADGTLSASGDDSFVIIPVSAVTWMGRAAGLPLFPPLNLAVNDIGGTGVDVGWTTANLIFNTDVSRSENLTFTPKVDVTLSFPRALSYRVFPPAGPQVSSGTGTSVTLRAGNKVRLDVPTNQTGSFQVTPSLSLAQHDISNRIEQAVQGSGEFKVLSAKLTTPKAEFDTGFGMATVWPGTSIDIGPVYRVDFPLATTRTTLLDATWSLGGFTTQTLAPFSLVPDPPPNVTPVTIRPVEGASFTSVVTTFTDDDITAVPADYAVTVNWGDGSAPTAGTVAGSNGTYTISGTHTYRQYGPYTIGLVLTTVPTGTLATNRVAFNSSAIASDAALAGTGKTNNTTAGGQGVLIWASPSPAAPDNVVATFTDANPFGLLSDLSATINWGDGTPVTPGVVSGPTGGPFTVAGTHDYVDLGLHTVTVKLLSKGGSTATTTTTTLSYTNPAGGGGFVVGAQQATGAVTFWGSQWTKSNGFKNATQSAFKGYENQAAPACGTSWSGNPSAGNGTPPATVPSYMPVIVTSTVSQAGTVTSGNVVAVVIVRTNAGYGPDPSLTGTGTVVAVLCGRVS